MENSDIQHTCILNVYTAAEQKFVQDVKVNGKRKISRTSNDTTITTASELLSFAISLTL